MNIGKHALLNNKYREASYVCNVNAKASETEYELGIVYLIRSIVNIA